MSGIEIFGVVTGGAGLISLGLQLGDCARRLDKLYHTAKDAPNSLRRLSFDLETMGMCLQMLEQQRQRQIRNTADTILARCIYACQQATNDIQQLLDKMMLRMEQHARFRGRLYFVFREQDVQQLLQDLERAKSSIDFAYMMYLAEIQRQRDEAHGNLLASQGNVLADVQARVASASGIASTSGVASQDLVSLHPNTSTGTVLGTRRRASTAHRRPHERQTVYRLTFRLPQQLYSKIWDSAFAITRSGWNFDLKTYHMVKCDAPIFYFCGIGDLSTMRKLLEAGEAGLLDVRAPHSYDRNPTQFATLIEHAALHAQVHICRFLLDQATWPDHSNTLSRALAAYSNRSLMDRSEIFRLFIDDPGFDAEVDPLEEESSRQWLLNCNDIDCFKDIIVPRLLTGSLETRFEVAMQIRFQSSTAVFLACLGIEATDPRISALRTQRDGRSILHYVAGCLWCLTSSRFADDQVRGVRGWVRLGVELLKSGADPCSLAETDIPRSRSKALITPLLECLAIASQAPPLDRYFDHWLHTAPTIIRLWAGMIQQSGRDLCKYGAQESDAWKSLSSKTPRNHWVEDTLVYGPNPEQWSLKIRTFDHFDIYKLKHPPGGFPEVNDAIPRTIIWAPSAEERDEGPWEISGSCPLRSRPVDIQDMVAEVEDSGRYRNIVNSVQDDAGMITLMQYRASKGRGHRPRSHSQPRSYRAGTERGNYNWASRLWLPPHHICPFNSTPCFSCCAGDRDNIFGPRDLRRCIKGETDGPESVQESASWLFYSFLAEISLCQAGSERRTNMSKYRATKRHTGTRQCPRNCAAVRLQELRVPESLRRYHPNYEVPWKKWTKS